MTQYHVMLLAELLASGLLANCHNTDRSALLLLALLSISESGYDFSLFLTGD
jgi:hypothetical protein